MLSVTFIICQGCFSNLFEEIDEKANVYKCKVIAADFYLTSPKMNQTVRTNIIFGSRVFLRLKISIHNHGISTE